MQCYVAGGCVEHGRNCFLIEGEKSAVLLDCGLMKELPGVPFPHLSPEQVRKADYLLLSHCHLDHTGALLWLYEKGFRGRVIATAFTLDQIPGRIADPIVIDEIAGPEEWITIDDSFRLKWGRSGHCLGSIWFLLDMEGKRILYSGDYTERSASYKADKIRNLRADLAIIDTAYGDYSLDGKRNRKAFADILDDLVEDERPLLFPVPNHGRGLDIMRLLAERCVPVLADAKLIREAGWALAHPVWARKRFLAVAEHLQEMRPITDSTPDELPSGACGILVADTSMKKEMTGRLARAVEAAGGKVVVTGKQLPGTRARQMVESGDAIFLRLSVHQNKEELIRLVKKNRITFAVPFHCRDELMSSDGRVTPMRTGDTLFF